MNRTVRTRFAPSPTGGLHLGGVRTALYSYLYAMQHGGQFILRIEDTDQSRFVEGAEQYIIQCLEWCGIHPHEGPHSSAGYGPYRQSERKELYARYALQLIESGHAYYAFDTPQELEAQRELVKTQNPHANFQYDHSTRLMLRNSLSLSAEETAALLASGTPFVIRIKMQPGTTIHFQDMIRGEISYDSSLVDDKVLLKADGMPTYHLAVVVDDYLMQITHAFRGEEWLPSAPIHLMLWEYLGWADSMPQWAHLPLILKPDGNGKLSKRDGDRLGFPVFPLQWGTTESGEPQKGFKELGFIPEAFVNMLAMLGWHSGSEQELYSLQELIQAFSMERVHKAGAKFDFEKAKWYNQQWIARSSADRLHTDVRAHLEQVGISGQMLDNKDLHQVIDLVKERCILLSDFVPQLDYFFRKPLHIDIASIKGKWSEAKAEFFRHWIQHLLSSTQWTMHDIEVQFKTLAEQQGIKVGELQLPLRIMLVGAKFGPNVFQIAAILGKEEVKQRVEDTLAML